MVIISLTNTCNMFYSTNFIPKVLMGLWRRSTCRQVIIPETGLFITLMYCGDVNLHVDSYNYWPGNKWSKQ